MNRRSTTRRRPRVLTALVAASLLALAAGPLAFTGTAGAEETPEDVVTPATLPDFGPCHEYEPDTAEVDGQIVNPPPVEIDLPEECTADVTVHKMVRTGPDGDDFVDGEGWEFSASDGVVPVSVDPSSGTTDSDGELDFTIDDFVLTWDTPEDFVCLVTVAAQILGGQATFADFDQCFDTEKTVTVTETVEPGYVIEQTDDSYNAECILTADFWRGELTSPEEISVQNTPNGVSFVVETLDEVTCRFNNQPLPSSITVVKETTSGVGGPFEFNVEGPNDTDEILTATTSQGDNPDTAGTVTDLYPGEYVISETDLPEGTSLEDIDCGDATYDTDLEDGYALVLLGPDEDVTCTFTDDTPYDLSVEKSGADPALGDTQMTYTIDVTNNGPGENEDPIVVTDTLPAGLDFASASGTGWVCDDDANIVTCTYDGQLGVGETASFTITADIDSNTIGLETTNCASTTDTTDDDDNDEGCVTNNTFNVSVLGALATKPAPPAAAAQAIAFTGAGSGELAMIGATLIGLGLAATLLTRRRRSDVLQ